MDVRFRWVVWPLGGAALVAFVWMCLFMMVPDHSSLHRLGPGGGGTPSASKRRVPSVSVTAAAVVAKGAAATPDPAKPLTGQCHCGQVRFRVEGPVVRCSYCDCRGCQRATGALNAPYVTVPRSGFAITAGAPASFRAASKAKCDCNGVWSFCKDCGAPLFWRADKGTELDILAGTLDDVSVFQVKE